MSTRSVPALTRAYRRLAVVLLNAALVFVGLNVAIALAERWQAPRTASAASTRGLSGWLAAQRPLHPGMDDEAILRLDRETWSRPMEYEPFTQFREAPYAGEFVRVSPHGFREGRGVAPWPPPADAREVVFLFGGSTAFGYGVRDAQTIAAHLAELMSEEGAGAVLVYDFGRGHYYSSQERVLFEELLAAGHVPDTAIFLDGFNDFRLVDGPCFAEDLAASFAATVDGARAAPWSSLPALRLARRLGVRLGLAQAAPAKAGTVLCRAADARPDVVVPRLLANWRAIAATAEAFGVRPLLVLQPVPYHAYDLEHHAFAGNLPLFEGVGVTYAELARQRAAGLDLGPDSLWLADMQRDLREPLYVDVAHYSGAMSRRIAERLAAALAVER
ncbi:MAG: hypothetical protein H6828_11430 [Planctomycetes bacterium]|nr:hypothetical protein [Planctomycetota bacterium]